MSKLRESPSRVSKHDKDAQSVENKTFTEKNGIQKPGKSDKENHAQKGGLVHFFICAVGICLSYLSYAFIHEHMSTSGFMKEHGPITSFIILTQSITNSMVAYIWMNIQNKIFGKEDAQQQSSKNTQSIESLKGEKLNNKFSLNHRLLFLGMYGPIYSMLVKL